MRCSSSLLRIEIPVVACLLFAGTPLFGQTVIIADNFSGMVGQPIAGNIPDTTNLPGQTYSTFGSTGTSTYYTGNTVQIGADQGTAISIASSGSYTQPSVITISAGLELGTTQGSDLGTTSVFRGVGLGFFSTNTGNNNGYSNFAGIVLNTDGSISFSQAPGGVESNLVVPSIAWPTATLGAFSATSTYAFSFTINTASASGGITNVSVSNGSTIDTADFAPIDNYSGTNIFAGSANFAGFMDTASNFFLYGYVSNFQVASSPPPTGSSWTGTANTTGQRRQLDWDRPRRHQRHNQRRHGTVQHLQRDQSDAGCRRGPKHPEHRVRQQRRNLDWILDARNHHWKRPAAVRRRDDPDHWNGGQFADNQRPARVGRNHVHVPDRRRHEHGDAQFRRPHYSAPARAPRPCNCPASTAARTRSAV